jgi:hypothetical protein
MQQNFFFLKKKKKFEKQSQCKEEMCKWFGNHLIGELKSCFIQKRGYVVLGGVGGHIIAGGTDENIRRPPLLGVFWSLELW